MQYWIILAGAIVLEVCGTVSMKFSEGFSRLLPSVLMFIFYGASFAALAIALKKIDVSVAYAIWSGLGTALIFAIGIFFFKESVSALKVLSLLLILTGVVGLKLSGAGH
ncbi:multidrug efflux SMR transporter [Desulfovibrio sp. JC010]|uniref:DMT family transporter n=1 Tax=Desulfovibrio sp. JC010 TaxID=2593641 RepID=UPI0013D766E0|nr:multidrug efflux SMR transporter [Desulfovibrio sp. JC010]NDV25230.1 multidrug efflux SMR transporter [Desulfovibrio sp. JC010]